MAEHGSYISLKEACDIWDISDRTMSRKISDKSISPEHVRRDGKSKTVWFPELVRVLGEPKHTPSPDKPLSEKAIYHPLLSDMADQAANDGGSTQKLVASLESQITRLENDLERERERADSERRERQDTTRQLQHQLEALQRQNEALQVRLLPEPENTQAEPKKGFLRRLFGG